MKTAAQRVKEHRERKKQLQKEKDLALASYQDAFRQLKEVLYREDIDESKKLNFALCRINSIEKTINL